MEKLYTDKDYADMAIQANEQGKKLIKVQEDVEYETEVLEWDYIDKEVEQQKTDEEGNPIYDEEGNPIMEVVTVQSPIARMVQETFIDDETGEEKTILVQAHHTETRTKTVERLEIVENPDNFTRKYFNTSLGYVSRVVHNLTGQTEDFLNDTLNYLQVGYPIITYNADGTQNRNVLVTEQFLEECKKQKEMDFYGQTTA